MSNPSKATSGELQFIASKDLKVGELLGEGAYGKVNRGVWQGREVVIKKFKELPKLLVQSFKTEAKTLAECGQKSPHIIKLLGFSNENGQISLVMEFMKSSLQGVLGDQSIDLPWDLRLRIAAAIAKGLSYLHGKTGPQGYLTSYNVMLDGDFNIKITDCGFSTLKLRWDEKSVRSLRWQAPELLKALVPTKAADVYAYGVILWEIDSRKIPFDSVKDSDIIKSVEEGTREPTTKDCPTEYSEIIQDSCAKEAAKRPSVADLVHRLELLSAPAAKPLKETPPLTSPSLTPTPQQVNPPPKPSGPTLAPQQGPHYALMTDKKISFEKLKAVPIEAFLEAIQQEPKNPVLYFNLCKLVPRGGTIKLLDGREMTEQLLLLTALLYDPNDPMYYSDLGELLPQGESITLLDGITVMTKQQLYLKAISLDPNCAFAYNNLGTTLPAGGKIQLPDGITVMTKQQLFLKAISIDPNYDAPHRNLGTTLPAGGKIQLPDGITVMIKQQLYLKAISLNPNYASAYNSLGITLPNGGSIRLLDGITVMTKQQLYLKAISLKPNQPFYYNNLANTLPNDGKIELPDRQVVSKIQLYFMALTLDPNYSLAKRNLGEMLPKGHGTELPDGIYMTKEQLLACN